MITIYLDILFLVNLYINYIILIITKRFLNLEAKKIRMLLSAAVSAVLAVASFFIPVNFFVAAISKIIIALAMCFIAFKFTSVALFLKSTLVMFIISFLLAGFFTAFVFWFTPKQVAVVNGTVYINISLIILCLLTALSYGIIELFTLISKNRVNTQHSYSVEVNLDGQIKKLKGLCDTGSSLIDIFTGKGIIICSYDAIESVIPENAKDIYKSTDFKINQLGFGDFQSRFRIVPVKTISGEDSLPGFISDNVVIKRRGDTKTISSAVIAVSQHKIFDGRVEALFGPSLLNT